MRENQFYTDMPWRRRSINRTITNYRKIWRNKSPPCRETEITLSSWLRMIDNR
jgi:hypothetical protein